MPFEISVERPLGNLCPLKRSRVSLKQSNCFNTGGLLAENKRNRCCRSQDVCPLSALEIEGLNLSLVGRARLNSPGKALVAIAVFKTDTVEDILQNYEVKEKNIVVL